MGFSAHSRRTGSTTRSTRTTRAIKGALALLFPLALVSGWSPNARLLVTHHPSPLSSQSSLMAGKGPKSGRRSNKPRVPTRRRPQVDDVLDNMSAPPTFEHSVDPASVPPGPPSDDPLAPLIRTIVKAADMRKASDIVAMRVSSCTAVTSFVVFASGTSRPQNQAIAAAVADDVEEGFDGKRTVGNGVPEGSADSGWIVLDYGECMVHVMTPRSRLFYDLEGQWRERGGEYMDISDVLVDENGPALSPAGSISDDGFDDLDDDDEEEEAAPSAKEIFDNVDEEDDPFWS